MDVFRGMEESVGNSTQHSLSAVDFNRRELGLDLEVAYEVTTLAVPIDSVMHT